MFGIWKTYRDVQKGIANPSALGQEFAIDVIKAPLTLLTFLAAVFFGALGTVAWSGLIGGPYLGLKIVFWLMFLPTLSVGAVAWMFIGKIERMMDRARQKLARPPDIIPAEVIKEDKDLT